MGGYGQSAEELYAYTTLSWSGNSKERLLLSATKVDIAFLFFLLFLPIMVMVLFLFLLLYTFIKYIKTFLY